MLFAGFKTKIHSIVFRITLVYLVITILNICVFVLLIFENQLDLIAENSVVNSQLKASNLKYRIDNVLFGTGGMEKENIDQVLEIAVQLDIETIWLLAEDGRVLASVEGNKRTDRENMPPEMLKDMHIAITKRDFEEKLFFHRVKNVEKTINLYIPYNYAVDQIAVAVIDLEMKDAARQMAYLYRQCVLIGALIIVIHAIFAFAVYKMLLIPLRTLNSAAQSISRGKLDVRIPIVRSDEIGQLANSFNEMSVSLRGMRDEAKGSNPLTGLPGNITIVHIIEEFNRSGREFCLIYCDLDNFKAYNDKYGFSKGDEVILYTRDCLVEVANKENMMDVFVGHQGGDDFVVICEYRYWETYVTDVIAFFDSGIPRFYNRTDARNRYIESINRQGEHQRFPLMSISIAVATNRTRTFNHPGEMIQVVTEVKKYVKSQEGSAFAIDKRTGPVTQHQTSTDELMRRY